MLSARLLSRLRRIDWDFTDSYSKSPFSNIHWHPCRFVSQIPATLIDLFTDRDAVVCDPFLGSGTTLFEAQRLGRQSIGFDLSPISCLISESKTVPVTSRTIDRYITDIRTEAVEYFDKQLTLHGRRTRRTKSIPSSVQTSKWYVAKVRNDLALLWALIGKYKGRKYVLAKSAFSAILIGVCRETRHWGYICDNTQPVSNHGGHVLHSYLKKLLELQNAYRYRDEDRVARLGSVTPIEPAIIKCTDAVSGLNSLSSNSVDAFITSPPYFGVCDYIKSQRLSMEWFDMELEPLRREEIGARSKRHRQSSKVDYINELKATLVVMKQKLKPKGILAMVIGQSTSREPVLDDIRASVRDIGFTLNADINRRVTSRRRQAPSLEDEHILVITK